MVENVGKMMAEWN